MLLGNQYCIQSLMHITSILYWQLLTYNNMVCVSNIRQIKQKCSYQCKDSVLEDVDKGCSLDLKINKNRTKLGK